MNPEFEQALTQIREQYLWPMANQLGLKWDIDLGIGNQPGAYINSSPGMRTHYISLSERYLMHPGEQLHDLLHELIHGKFAETIDPIFSAVALHSEDQVTRPRFAQEAQLVHRSQAFVDVWVADSMSRIDRDLTIQDVTSMLAQVEILSTQITDPGMHRLTVVTNAINYADTQRLKIPALQRRYEKVQPKPRKSLGKEGMRVTTQLSQLYSGLPQLPQDPNEAVKLFSDYAQETASIMQLPIVPKLVQERNRWVWQIEDR